MSTSRARTRAIGYARISRETEESTSIARQREAISGAAAARGWDLVEIVEDVSVSATKARLDRPGLDRVRQAIRDRRADVVLVWRLDRIARSVVDFGTILDEGVEIASATEPLDTTSAMGRAMAEILQVFAAMEARTISARVSSSVEHLRRAHRWPGGPLPYGYRSVPHPDGTGRALALDPEKAPFVRELADRYLAGESAVALAREFTRRGVPPARNARGWTPEAVRRILTGNAALGRVVVNGDVLRDEHGLPVEVWPPILTVEESARIRARFALNKAPQTRRRSVKRLLSGIIVCGSCGMPMHVHNPRPRSTTPSTLYHCRSRVRGVVCEAPVSISAHLVEPYVVETFLRVVGRFEVVEEVVASADPTGLAEVEEAIADTARAMTAPGADLVALGERLAALHARREEIKALPVEPLSAMIATGRTFAEEWEARETIAERRALLADAIAEVVVVKAPRGASPEERVDIVWHP